MLQIVSELRRDGEQAFFVDARDSTSSGWVFSRCVCRDRSASRGTNLPPHERRVGYVPQDLALFPHLTVQQNVLYGVSNAATEEHGRPVLQILEIQELLSRTIDSLSGGERQRVALARALMVRPRILLLDEPLAALDIALRDRILPYLERVREELKTPMIYVSHVPDEIRQIADRVICLDAGQVVGSSVPAEAFGAETGNLISPTRRRER